MKVIAFLNTNTLKLLVLYCIWLISLDHTYLILLVDWVDIPIIIVMHAHWSALERVFKYLKDTINYGIHYFGFLAVVEGFSDVNWIYDSDETKSTSGYVFTLGGVAFSWKSTKQSIISCSAMETEFITLDTTSIEAK